MYGWELSDKNELVVVKRFGQSATEDMEAHIKPPLKNDLSRIIFHISTNYSKSSQDPETTAESSINVAKNNNNSKTKILISSTTPCRNNPIGKVCQVN